MNAHEIGRAGRRRWLALCATLALALPATAHDYWIEPASWTPQPGSVVAVRHLVGHAGHAEEVPRNPDRIVRFDAVQADDVRPVVGRDGGTPAGWVRLDRGLQRLAYESRPVYLELPADRFRAYLLEESLDRIVGERSTRGEQESPGRELYSRCARAIVRVGSSSSPDLDRPLGLTLEIVALEDPTTPGSGSEAGPGRALPVELRFRGRPLPGARLTAERLDHDGEPELPGVSAVTDAEGRATLELPSTGAWVVTTVHMERARPNEHGADWRSWWGSLTFRVPEPAVSPGGTDRG